MNESNDDEATPVIEVRPITGNARLAALPRHFGAAYMMAFESYVFDTMRRCCPDYHGGLWEYFDLSNGGFYMAPNPLTDKTRVIVATNGYEGEMSNEAAGIMVTLCACSHLSFTYEGKTDAFAEHYHLLRDYAAGHPEAVAIFAAND